MGVGEAGGSAIELGERERGADSSCAARLFRDRDGGKEGGARGRGVGRVAFTSVSPRTRFIRFNRAEARAVGGRQRSSRMATARSGSPARASASASPTFRWPSNIRTFCSRRSSAPWRVSSSPSAGAPCATPRNPAEHRERVQHLQVVLPCEADESNAFCAARAGSPRINANMAACILPNASVPTSVRTRSASACGR